MKLEIFDHDGIPGYSTSRWQRRCPGALVVVGGIGDREEQPMKTTVSMAIEHRMVG